MSLSEVFALLRLGVVALTCGIGRLDSVRRRSGLSRLVAGAGCLPYSSEVLALATSHRRGVMTTVDEALGKLVANQFRPIDLSAVVGMPQAMLFVFAHDEPYMDSVMVRSEDEAAAYRRLMDESDASIYGTGNLVWYAEGAFVDVVEELVNLPHPRLPVAPRLVISTPSSLWLPVSAR